MGEAEEDCCWRRWDQARRNYLQAEAAMAAAERGPDAPLAAAIGRYMTSVRQLLSTPAPHMAAFALKIECAADHQIITFANRSHFAEALQADLIRLARL